MNDETLGMLGRYTLVRRLGRGEMTEAFEARVEGAAGVTKRLCVKRILPAFARDRRFMQVFARQVRLSMALQHGNIAQMLDLGREGGEIFVATELVDGVSLDRLRRVLIKQGARLPVPLAVYLMIEACRALEHIHTRADERGRPLDMVHGDLVPANVLLSFDGQVKLIDPGLGRALREEDHAKELCGRLPYRSPEQRARDLVDTRSDVYSAGAILFELLSGRPPIPRGSRGGDIQPLLEEVEPSIDPALCVIVDRAVAPEPEERFASARDLEEILAHYLHHQGELVDEEELGTFVRRAMADGAGIPGEASPEARAKRGARGRARITMAAASVALLIAGSAAAVLLLQGEEIDPAPAHEVEVRSLPPGARVLVGGAESGVYTDGVLRGLPPDEAHELSFLLPGYVKETRTIEPGRSSISVRLRRETLRPAAVIEEIEDAPRLARREPIVRARGPRGTELRLDQDAATVRVRDLPGRWLTLDPSVPHTLEVTGGIHVALVRPIGRLSWIAMDGEGELLAHGQVDPSGPARVPGGAARLKVLRVQGGGCDRNVGEATAVVRARGRVAHRVTIEGRLDCVAMSGNVETVLRDLLGEPGYRLRYEGPADGPPLFVGASSPNPLALTREADEGTRTLLPGEEMRVYYVGTLHFAVFERSATEERLVLRFEAIGEPEDSPTRPLGGGGGR